MKHNLIGWQVIHKSFAIASMSDCATLGRFFVAQFLSYGPCQACVVSINRQFRCTATISDAIPRFRCAGMLSLLSVG